MLEKTKYVTDNKILIIIYLTLFHNIHIINFRIEKQCRANEWRNAMKFLNKLQRKFGKYAVPNLMYYIIILYIIGIVLNVVNPYLYYSLLAFDVEKILQGQIWRLVTFLIQPVSSLNLFLLFELYLYYMIGTSLERAWGSFRFNLYFLSGILFNILGAILVYAITGATIDVSLTYINQSMFFAYAALYPNVQLLLFFVIPIKIKYLGIMYGVVYLYEAFTYLRGGYWLNTVTMIFALANFLLYFFATRNYKRVSPREYKRKAKFKREVRNAYNPDNVIQFRGKQTVTRHKCAVCGRTELDDDNLEFRFCSKCDGNYEYCMDHHYTHEHVHHNHTDNKESNS